MTSELPFAGFRELILNPLANSDQRSLALIKRIFIEDTTPPTQPFTVLMQKLSGKIFTNSEALVCWKQILKHKVHLQQKLGRTVGIQTATIDYFEYQSPDDALFSLPPVHHESIPDQSRKSMESLYAQRGGYYLEKLKEEIQRARRYKHALAVIMIDIDNFDIISGTLDPRNYEKLFSTIIGIIKKIIRNVDILHRLSSDRFLLILPNTNAREARELAERIRIQIAERTGRLTIINESVTATLSVGQCMHDHSSVEFIRRLERILEEGKHRNHNAVYLLS